MERPSYAVRLTKDTYEALDELRWEERFRSMNQAVRWLLAHADVEPFNEEFEDEDEE